VMREEKSYIAAKLHCYKYWNVVHET